MTAAHASFERFEQWFITAVLPLWAEKAWDHKNGGFVETIGGDGAPLVTEKRRVRVQSRQVYSFTRAAKRGWRQDGEALAARGFDFLITRLCPDDCARGCVHTFLPSGDIVDDRRDLYDQAFLLLACAARWDAVKDGRALDVANKTIDFIVRELKSPHGGYLESDRGETPRRQNPHMHLFEAFLTLYEATNDQAYLSCAEEIYDLFKERFLDANAGVLREFFDETLTALPGDAGARIEPGHMMEWVWLLKRRQKAVAENANDLMSILYENALRHGADASGFLVDSAILGHEPAGARRLWPQTEHIKAALALLKEKEAADVIDRLFNSYLSHDTNGLWFDCIDAAGAPVSAATPASIIYHLFEAVDEVRTYRMENAAS